MVQISCNPADLNGAQRKAVADFVLNFPGACAGLCGGVPHETTVVAEIHDTTATVALVPQVNELDALQHDHESTMPEAAFGAVDTAPAAAFGLPDIGQLEVSPAAAFGGAPAAPLAGSIPAIVPPSTVAPAAPVNTAPITTTPGPVSLAAGAAPAGVELDKHGLPWDNRIHAESKAKIADGFWRKKRGVDPVLVAQVEAELRQVMEAPSSPLVQGVAPAMTPVPVAASTTVPAAPTGAVPQQVAPPPAPAPVVGAAPSMPAAPSAAPGAEVALPDPRQQFVALIGRASAAIQAGKVTQEEINQVCQGAGIPALPLLANRLDLVGTVAASIDAIIASRGQ